MASPLQLAYIGDAVYEVLVRSYILETVKKSVNDLHNIAIKFVKAKSQADIVHFLKDDLTEDEHRIIKRGRNTKSATIPKNANITDYRYATGFEALIGYLYLTDNIKRINEIFDIIIRKYKEQNIIE
ncbi:ribonuclease III domain-containing protein [Clostridiaceae bacterium M8S5]|nr:ribonuclease III domain-containing protein [Clostridiaceae bacterium M8S5]